MESFHPELLDIFCTPRILATFPFDKKFRLSKRLLAYCVLVRLVSAVGAVDASLRPSLLNAKSGQRVSLTLALTVLAVILALGDNFFAILWWIKKRETVTLLMENIDMVLRRSKVRLVRRQIRFVHYLLCICCATFVFSFCNYRNKKNVMQYVRRDFSYFLISTATLSFIGQLRDLLNLLSFLFQKNTQMLDESSIINYERFLSLCELVNDIYDPQILFTITKHFLQVIFYFYILLLPLHPGMISSNILTCFLAAFNLIQIASIICACNKYTYQEKRFNEQLRRRMVEEKSPILLKNEKLNLHFIVGRQTVFTACGFFNIERSLVCSMISAATTYLVIVLQYGKDEVSKVTSSAEETVTSVMQPETSTYFN